MVDIHNLCRYVDPKLLFIAKRLQLGEANFIVKVAGFSQLLGASELSCSVKQNLQGGRI